MPTIPRYVLLTNWNCLIETEGHLNVTDITFTAKTVKTMLTLTLVH